MEIAAGRVLFLTGLQLQLPRNWLSTMMIVPSAGTPCRLPENCPVVIFSTSRSLLKGRVGPGVCSGHAGAFVAVCRAGLVPQAGLAAETAGLGSPPCPSGSSLCCRAAHLQLAILSSTHVCSLPISSAFKYACKIEKKAF